MTLTPRDQIINTTCTLLEKQGYHATGLNEIVKESGAPKGSLYHYFPEGKEEIAAEAIGHIAQLTAERIRENLLTPPSAAEAVKSFAETIAHHVEASGFQAGGPLTTIALETAVTSPRLNLACREAYDLLQQAFLERLEADGFSQPQASRLALFIVAAVEGAIILSRTHHSGDPLRSTAAFLEKIITQESTR